MKQNKKKYWIIGSEKNKAIFKDGSSLDLHHVIPSGIIIFGEKFTIELESNYQLIEHYHHINAVHKHYHCEHDKNGLTAKEIVYRELSRYELMPKRDEWLWVTRLLPVLNSLREEFS